MFKEKTSQNRGVEDKLTGLRSPRALGTSPRGPAVSPSIYRGAQQASSVVPFGCRESKGVTQPSGGAWRGHLGRKARSPGCTVET